MKSLFAFSFLNRYLDPAEQLSDLLFGLMMAMIVTLRYSLRLDEPEDTENLILYLLGGNGAWGVIQGWLFTIEASFRRGYKATLIHSVQMAENEEVGIARIQAELEDRLEDVTSEEGQASLYRDIYRSVKNVTVPKNRPRRDDLLGALAVFLLVTATAIPAAVPLLLFDSQRLALRVGNVLLFTLLFVVGCRYATVTNLNPWKAGLVILLTGIPLAILAAQLGG